MRCAMVAFCLALTTCSVPSTIAAEADWTGLLGPDRNGWVEGFETPTVWPEELQQQWRVKVGVGYGTPIVASGRVFQHARQGDEEVVWCLDLESGETHWRKSYPAPFKMGGGGERHGKGPKSCPVYADGRLFTFSITGLLAAWDAETGKQLWRRRYDSRFQKTHPYWGVSSSPIVDQDRVIVHHGNDDVGALIALDVKTGEEVWSQGKDGASYSSPLLVEVEGVRQVVQWNHNAVVGVESKSGRPLWRFPLPHEGSNQNMPTPTFHEGCIIVGGENRGIRSIRLRETDGEWTATEKWFQSKVALDMSTAVVNGDALFGFSHYGAGRLFCLDLATGGIRWMGPGRLGQNVAFLSVPNHVLALVNNGQLLVVSTKSDSYQKKATYRVASGETWAPPVLLNDGLLIKNRDTLTRWKLPR